MQKNRFLSLILILTISIISCRQVRVYEGEVEILGKTFDSTLNDSVMVYGKVLSAINRNAIYGNESRIWATEMGKETYSDKYTGEYFIKLLGGEYTLNCLGEYADESEVLVASDIFLHESEKIELNFYLKGVVE